MGPLLKRCILIVCRSYIAHNFSLILKMEQIMTCNDIVTESTFTLRQDDPVQILTRNVDRVLQNEINWASENARVEKALREYESKSQKALHKSAKKIKRAPRHEIRPDGAYKLCIYLADYFGDTEPE